MKTKSFILYILLLVLACSFGRAKLQHSVKKPMKPENKIVFNGWYHTGKEKWQGSHHNPLLFTWYTARTSAANEKEYWQLIKNQRDKGVKFIGYYYSSTVSYSYPPERYAPFPEPAIPPAAIKYSWILRDNTGKLVTWTNAKNRYFLDVGMKEVREAILFRAVSNAKSLGANVLFLDNWNYKSFAPAGQTKKQWAEKNLALLKRARELTNQYNLKLIVNQASYLQDWKDFATYLDGFGYEMSTHPNYLNQPKLYKLELDTYEQMMAMGKSIFLYTYAKPGHGKRRKRDGRRIATTAMLVMPQNQPYWGGIYVCPPQYEIWPVGGWPMWPEQLGKPLGPRQWTGNTVTRKFERGSISVTVGKEPKFNISFEY